MSTHRIPFLLLTLCALSAQATEPLSPKSGFPPRSRQFTQEACEALMRAPRNTNALLININGVTLQPDTQGTLCRPGLNDITVMNRPLSPEESAAWRSRLEASGAVGPGGGAPSPATR